MGHRTGIARRLTLLVVVGCLILISPTAAAGERHLHRVDADCKQIDQRFRCLYGPIDVHPGENVLRQRIPAPPKGWILEANARLVHRVNAEWQEIPHHSVHLHHVSWEDTTRGQLLCDYNREVIYITGAERTRMTFPKDHAYRWSGTEPFWRLAGMLHGRHEHIYRHAYVKLNFRFVAGSAGAFTPVRNNFVPVTGCGADNTYTVQKSDGTQTEDKRTYTLKMPVDGRFVWGTGHMHDGGLRMILRNRTDDATIFVSEALYAHGGWELTGTTNFSDPNGIEADAGDVLKVTALYDNSQTRLDVMANLRAALVVEPAPSSRK